MKILKGKHGGGYITPCIITLVIAMILSAVLFYAECMTIIQATVDNTESKLFSNHSRHCCGNHLYRSNIDP